MYIVADKTCAAVKLVYNSKTGAELNKLYATIKTYKRSGIVARIISDTEFEESREQYRCARSIREFLQRLYVYSYTGMLPGMH